MPVLKPQVQLQQLLKKEFSTSSDDQNRVISGYRSLIDLLSAPRSVQQLRGHHELLFQCISQILLTPFHRHFDDEQLRVLIDVASHSCVLSMCQNQTMDRWAQNIDERAFEKPDGTDDDDEIEGDDDDDESYEDISESEELAQQKATRRPWIKNGSDRDHVKPPHEQVIRTGFYTTSLNETRSPATRLKSDIKDQNHAGHSRADQNAPRNLAQTKHSANSNRLSSGPDRNPPNHSADNRSSNDRILGECYNCGEYGHRRSDCPKRKASAPGTPRKDHHEIVTPPKTPRNAPSNAHDNKENTQLNSYPSTSSSAGNNDTTMGDIDRNKIAELANLASKLLNSPQITDERNGTLTTFCRYAETLQKKHGDRLAKIFREKEPNFYALFCHVAQHQFLFTDQQYAKLYQCRSLLLPSKQRVLSEDRSTFARQRPLMPLKTIEEHIRGVSQLQQPYFNDFQEYLLRSTPPISNGLFNLTKHLLQSNIHVDATCLEYFTTQILFQSKTSLFSPAQLDELRASLLIRTQRSQRSQQKQIWKTRLGQFKGSTVSADLEQWLRDFAHVLNSGQVQQEDPSTIAVDHAMWYFAVLSMASSGHLNKTQYEYLLGQAMKSSLFNRVQKFYFQFYLTEGHAPITMPELAAVQSQLASQNVDEKRLGLEQLKRILERPKPEMSQEKIEPSSTQSNDSNPTNKECKTPEDAVPIIDDHILARLTSLAEMICSDDESFSTEQCEDFLDRILRQSTIVRPLPQKSQQRLQSYHLRPLSLAQLRHFCSSMPSDLNEFLAFLKQRTLPNDDALLDYLTETIVKILNDRSKLTDEQRQNFFSFVDKQAFGKKRYQPIYEAYQKSRINPEKLQPTAPAIDRSYLSQLLNSISRQEYQAYLDFFTLLEQSIPTIDLEQTSIDFEIIRCYLSSIILLIADVDFSNATNANFFRQRLKTLMGSRTDFFVSLLTDRQLRLINTRLTTAGASTSSLDLFIDALQKETSEQNLVNLLHYIPTKLTGQQDRETMINLILSTFDKPFLSIEQTLRIIEAMQHNAISNHKPLKNLLQFLVDLLQLKMHLSPQVLLKQLQRNPSDEQSLRQAITMLEAANGKDATAEWKRTMTELVLYLAPRNDQISTLAEQSPMLQGASFQKRLKSSEEKASNDQPDRAETPSAVPKNEDEIDNSAAHREMFRCLDSSDPSENAFVVQQLHSVLRNGELPPFIAPTKFVQALQMVFKSPTKFSQVSVDEWTILVSNNRGKAFLADPQCDLLLMSILFARLHLSTDSVRTLHRLIQSKKSHERHDGIQQLLVLLNKTKITKPNDEQNRLLTLSDELYRTTTDVVFNERFPNDQVRQCLTAAKTSWLLSEEHRQRLENI